MSFWDIFKKKKKPEPLDDAKSWDIFDKKEQLPPLKDAKSKEEIYQMLFDFQRKRAPSEKFADGAMFDISRLSRDSFKKIVYANDALRVLLFFQNAYALFCDHPEVVNLPKDIINVSLNDTDYRKWNADTFTFENGDAAALCFMPIQNDELDARIIGIILSDRGDGYYYCMLNKGEETPSNVRRNRGAFGISEVGQVSGRGFDLMNSFLDCIRKDFDSNSDTRISP